MLPPVPAFSHYPPVCAPDPVHAQNSRSWRQQLKRFAAFKGNTVFTRRKTIQNKRASLQHSIQMETSRANKLGPLASTARAQRALRIGVLGKELGGFGGVVFQRAEAAHKAAERRGSMTRMAWASMCETWPRPKARAALWLPCGRPVHARLFGAQAKAHEHHGPHGRHAERCRLSP